MDSFYKKLSRYNSYTRENFVEYHGGGGGHGGGGHGGGGHGRGWGRGGWGGGWYGGWGGVYPTVVYGDSGCTELMYSPDDTGRPCCQSLKSCVKDWNNNGNKFSKCINNSDTC